MKDLDERIQKQQEEEEERKRLKRARKKEKKVKRPFLSSFAHHLLNPNFTITTSKKFMHTPIDSSCIFIYEKSLPLFCIMSLH